ncbi:MAG TPA: MFS transporter [Telluria sp.]|nr:MFS transporter [Telluria sp.]
MTAPRTTRLALASLALSMLLSSLGTSIANIALPTLALAFGASFQTVQWVVLAYLLAITSLIVSAGRLGDLAGRKRVLMAGVALFTAGALLCGAAPTLPVLIAARAIQGVGAAAMMALTMALVSEAVPKDRTGSAMGMLGTMSAVGTALGPSLGGALIAWLGWRAVFFVNVPLGLAALLLAARFLPAGAPAAASGPRFDPAGTLLLALSLAAYALAMTLGHGRAGAANVVLLAAAVLGAIGFAVVERRARAPLVRLDLFLRPGLGVGLAATGLVSTVMMATLVVGPFYLGRALGLSAAQVGLVISAGPVVSALSGVPAGLLVDRIGAVRVMRVGLVGVATGAAALALLPGYAGVAGYLGALVVTTSGYALFQAANNTAVMADVEARQRGLVSGMLNLARNLGLVTGASAMGAVFAYAAGTPDLATAAPAAVARGMQQTFLLAAALIVAALLMVSGNQWRGRATARDTVS